MPIDYVENLETELTGIGPEHLMHEALHNREERDGHSCTDFWLQKL